MERLTFEGNFCDIARCSDIPGGSFCEDGACSQRKVWERLKAYEDTGYEPGEILSAIEKATKSGETKTATIMAECIAGAMKDTLEKYGTAAGKGASQ